MMPLYCMDSPQTPPGFRAARGSPPHPGDVHPFFTPAGPRRRASLFKTGFHQPDVHPFFATRDVHPFGFPQAPIRSTCLPFRGHQRYVHPFFDKHCSPGQRPSLLQPREGDHGDVHPFQGAPGTRASLFGCNFFPYGHHRYVHPFFPSWRRASLFFIRDTCIPFFHHGDVHPFFPSQIRASLFRTTFLIRSTYLPFHPCEGDHRYVHHFLAIPWP